MRTIRCTIWPQKMAYAVINITGGSELNRSCQMMKTNQTRSFRSNYASSRIPPIRHPNPSEDHSACGGRPSSGRHRNQAMLHRLSLQEKDQLHSVQCITYLVAHSLNGVCCQIYRPPMSFCFYPWLYLHNHLYFFWSLTVLEKSKRIHLFRR